MSHIKEFYWQLCLKKYSLEKERPILRKIGVELTRECNLACQHCYMDARKQGQESELTVDDWICFLEGLRNDFKPKPTIMITGGEPLLKKGFLEIIKRAKELGFVLTIASNGTLFNESNAKTIIDHSDSISISLDGPSAIHEKLRSNSNYLNTLETIRTLRRLSPKRVNVKTAITRYSLPHLREIHSTLKEIGINQWDVFPIEKTGRAQNDPNLLLSQEEYDRLCQTIDELRKDKKGKIRINFEEGGIWFLADKAAEQNKYKLCGAGINNCSIKPNGDVVSCLLFSDRVKVQGNIKTQRLKEIWEKGFKEFRAKDYRHCHNHYHLKP